MVRTLSARHEGRPEHEGRRRACARQAADRHERRRSGSLRVLHPTSPRPVRRMMAPMENIEAALNLLEGAELQLVLIGKDMAWSRAENEVRAFIERPNCRSCVRRWARA